VQPQAEISPWLKFTVDLQANADAPRLPLRRAFRFERPFHLLSNNETYWRATILTRSTDIATLKRSDGIEPLRHSLVLNAITTDEDLIDDLVNEPTVTNVYRGHHRTYYTTPTTPHDGYLADPHRCQPAPRQTRRPPKTTGWYLMTHWVLAVKPGALESRLHRPRCEEWTRNETTPLATGQRVGK
jgi:hypothetical protein